MQCFIARRNLETAHPMKFFRHNIYSFLSIRGLCIATFSLLSQVTLLASDPVLGIEGEIHSSVGIYIKDIKADTVVFESDADRTLIPASITKALTSATAMTVLKPDFVYETKVYTSGNIKNGILQGNLIIKASGDPTLDSEQFPKKKGFVSEIVRAVKAKGITGIEGKITLLRVNPDYQYPEGPIDHWGIDDTPWAYGAGIFDFNWSDNYFSYYPAKGTSNPDVPGLDCTIWKKPLPSGFNLIRGVYSTNLILTGADLLTDRKRRVNTSMPYPFDSFKVTLEKELKSAGIAVTGKTLSPENRSLLLSHNSPSLGEIMKIMMFRSDNMFTEGVLRRFNSTPAKYGDIGDALNVEMNLWKERGLHPEYITVYDGSGLSRANQISPRFMGEMLEWMARSNMADTYVGLFPVAGHSGTMKNFLAKTSLDGRLAMKTGSMSAVQCYAGYLLDSKGCPSHVVVVMVNNFFCSRSNLKAAISNFLLSSLSDKLK